MAEYMLLLNTANFGNFRAALRALLNPQIPTEA